MRRSLSLLPREITLRTPPSSVNHDLWTGWFLLPLPVPRRALNHDGKHSSGAHLGLQAEMETLIEHSHLFKSLDDEGRLRALRESSLHTFPAGTVILREGEPGDEFYLIANGAVRVDTTGPDVDHPVELATLGRGAFFGEVSVLTGRPRTATVTAIDEVLVVVFSQDLVERLLEAYPRVRKLLDAVVLGRARDTIDKLTTR